MMKRFLLVAMMILSTFGVFAQGKSIEEMNGYDWMGMTVESKISLVRGYYIACTMLMYMSYEIAQAAGSTQDQLTQLGKQLDDQFSYADSTVGMAQKLDNYYASPSARTYLIFRTIPFLAGKEWWNRNTGKVESRGPAS